ncbi:BA14K family protein [Shinella sp. BE166]|uniref:BA14K family protein n=1 Tax=Shinella sp. BE166 TaxID=3373918 RepID=UPI003EBECDF4
MAAFGAGAIISGAISSQQWYSAGSHAQWCANRYRTYRAYDNTCIPYASVRAKCVSPY